MYIRKKYKKGSKKSSRKSSKKSYKKTSKKGSRKSSKKGSKKTSKKGSKKINKKGSRKNSKKGSRKSSKKSSKKITKKGSKKISKKGSRKNSKKDSKKISKKGSMKNSKKASRKNSKKSSRKISKRNNYGLTISRKNSKQLNFPPKIVHQIWFGKKIPKFKKLYMSTVKKYFPNFKYKLWTNKDLTKIKFPNTFDTIQKIIKYAEIKGINRFAQVADLARYEILYRYGGVYIDTNIEFFKNAEELFDASFVVVNEDPCELNCKVNGKKYLSNSLIGSIPMHPIMKRAISKQNLKDIYLEKAVNYSTGPFYLRKMVKKEPIKFLKTNDIFPFINWESEYRRKGYDKCFSKIEKTGFKKIGEYQYIKFPCNEYKKGYAINHWNLGGTWH